jgi:hypothetical protein
VAAVKSREKARETEEAARFIIQGCYVRPQKLFQSITPKAFANFSPGLERSDNPGK